jgi:indolepyruvate ferredoxin oxidoreductase alpha subunit
MQNNESEKTALLMLGNEAVARGAWEAGCRVVASYPGTPSTEITEFAATYPEMNVEWAVNEKVAMEIAAGAAIGGARTMTCMKHVGMNVAADPLFTLAYTGARGGLVVVVADDPGIHSSQNEQDSRYYARSAHLPMLIPADARECLELTKKAFELSELYDTPVILGTCTRVAHARSMVSVGERKQTQLPEWSREPSKYVMLPGPARARHIALEQRERRVASEASADWAYRVERPAQSDRSVGVICSGAAYQYAREALEQILPAAPILKLNLVHPLPENGVREFAESVDKLYIIEELEPFIEEAVRALGIPCEGKSLTGRQGELSVAKIRRAFGAPPPPHSAETSDAPPRAPAMCPGCPHSAVFYALARRKYTVSGDIGCYTLGMLAPHRAMDACLCMGASIGIAFGLEKARGKEFSRNTVAVIGDSTFLHSGMTALLDAVYNRASITLLILDNRITGMTGHQHNPASGFDIHGQPAPAVDLEALVRALGVEYVSVLDPFDLPALEKALARETAREAVSVLILKRECALLNKKRGLPYHTRGCRDCGACMRLGCPALSRDAEGVHVDETLCVGCGLCAKVCPFDALITGGAV